MLSAIQLRFLQALALDTKARSASDAAAYFADNFGLGARIGRRYEYTTGDARRAQELLAAMGLESAALAAGTDRADAVLRPGLSEKIGTVSPHASSVAFQVLSMPASVVDADMKPVAVMPVTSFGYQVGHVREVSAIQSDLVLVVENCETFRQIHRYGWVQAMLPPGKSVLSIFRGDSWFRPDDAQQVLQRSTAPVWGFFDFDPSGLQMCSSLARLEKVVLPPLAALERATRLAKRDDLFYQQTQSAANTLNACKNPEIQAAWALLQRLRMGLPQEWMRDLG